MTEHRFVLDTNVVIALVDGTRVPPGIGALLKRAEVFISVITEIEVFAKKTMTPLEEAAARAFTTGIPVVDINDVIKMHTIALRRSTALKLPDCIIAATSIALNATLLTNDTALLKLNQPGFTARSIY